MEKCWPLKMPPTAKAVLMSLADNANEQGACWPSHATIAKRTCFSKRAVIDALAWLESARLLVANRSNGRHTTYRLTPEEFTEPVQLAHQCSSRTSAAPAPDQCSSRTQPVQLPHQPVRQMHTNHQEPSRTIKEHLSTDVDSSTATLVALDQGPPECPHAEIVAAYHEVLPELRQVREWSANRQKFLRSRWREDPERQSVAWWRDFFRYIRGCDFLMGKTGGQDGRTFDCHLEWIVKPANFLKILEGRYENRGTTQANTRRSAVDRVVDHIRAARESDIRQASDFHDSDGFLESTAVRIAR